MQQTPDTNDTQAKQTNEYKGISLFNDIEDMDLRIRNRSVVMANIAESNSRDKKISPNGLGLIMGYFNQIKQEERRATVMQFIISMNERGFKMELNNG